MSEVVQHAENLAVESDQLLQEVRQLASSLDAGDGSAPGPHYSSSTTSCETDADGVVTLTIKLYPGNEAIPADSEDVSGTVAEDAGIVPATQVPGEAVLETATTQPKPGEGEAGFQPAE